MRVQIAAAVARALEYAAENRRFGFYDAARQWVAMARGFNQYQRRWG